MTDYTPYDELPADGKLLDQGVAKDVRERLLEEHDHSMKVRELNSSSIEFASDDRLLRLRDTHDWFEPVMVNGARGVMLSPAGAEPETVEDDPNDWRAPTAVDGGNCRLGGEI